MRNRLASDITIPSTVSAELAEETGIHVGDGYLGIHKYPSCFKYQYVVAGGVDDKAYLEDYVAPLVKLLYNKDMTLRRYENTYTLYCYCKEIALFKKDFGLPVGRKDNLRIPPRILESKFVSDFLRGLFDTDGCLTFKKRYRDYPYYPCLSIASRNDVLIRQADAHLRSLGFNTSMVLNSSRTRLGTVCLISNVYMYGRKNAKRWGELIGFSNPKNTAKFEFGVENGFI
ncbi:MAG: LAGLIDADG family homing endonuclease [Candidatus Micrarchaeota archaeon]